MCILLLLSMSDCTTCSVAARIPGTAFSSTSNSRNGDLIVYSATYSPTLEQSEYPTHTNYTIATVDGHVIEHVTNATGSFNSRPARVQLPAGKYQVRAQYNGGRFVTFPIVIEPETASVVDLDGEEILAGWVGARQMVRLPGGQVIGWSATSRF